MTTALPLTGTAKAKTLRTVGTGQPDGSRTCRSQSKCLAAGLSNDPADFSPHVSPDFNQSILGRKWDKCSPSGVGKFFVFTRVGTKKYFQSVVW